MDEREKPEGIPIVSVATHLIAALIWYLMWAVNNEVHATVIAVGFGLLALHFIATEILGDELWPLSFVPVFLTIGIWLWSGTGCLDECDHTSFFGKAVTALLPILVMVFAATIVISPFVAIGRFFSKKS